jgi:sulfur dioxygenase
MACASCLVGCESQGIAAIVDPDRDVREPWEYQRGQAPRVLLIPLGQLASRTGELDPGRLVAVICERGSCSQSATALLGQRGFRTIYNVTGGTSTWRYSGLEVER